jgi:hypothetical protein
MQLIYFALWTVLNSLMAFKKLQGQFLWINGIKTFLSRRVLSFGRVFFVVVLKKKKKMCNQAKKEEF